MVDALTIVVTEGILKKVVSIATSEVVLAWSYKEKLTTLCKTSEMICAKLRDAEKQMGNEAVILWLKELKDVADEADNVMDEVHYEMLRREVKRRDRKTRKVPSLSLKRLSFRREMSHKIENISKRLSDINKLANDLGLQNEQASLCPESLHQESDSYLDEFKIVGRENDELHIIQLLTESTREEKLAVVPVVGMGGIGKTTLAKSVYNNPKIKQEFDVRAWLCVSVKTDINTLLAKIYESLTGMKCEVQTRENLIGNLRKELDAKRYLLVLDDVWDEKQQHWDDFRSCMLKVNSHNGSCILVTARSLEIGTNAMTHKFRTLQGLSNEQCWSIFKERAFVTGRSPLPELEEIGRDIVKRCCGLPLVVKVIGSMLKNYNDKEKWLAIRDSKVWDLEEGDKVLNTLKLSFDNLPNSIVKQCFVYCSIFEKDTVMKRTQLLQLWMALGLLQVDEMRDKEMEDVGNDIFQTLVSNTLFQDVEMDEYGYPASCKMHDLVHDLSLSLSRHESLCLVGPINDVCISDQVKHLSIYQDDVNMNLEFLFRKRISTEFKEDMTSRTLQSLFFMAARVENNISFRNFKCLRILNFSRCRLKKIHSSVGDLVHLRYLDLSYTMICVIPKSVGKLYHLQTLKLIGCDLIENLLLDVTSLISLRHLEFDAMRLSLRVRHLTSLQTLPSFGVGQEDGCQIEELGYMKHLRGKLCIYNLEQVNNREEAAKADLSRKKNLFEIVFCWGDNKGANRNDKDVLEGLQPHANVKGLKIKSFSGDSFPTWVTKMAINIQGNWTPLDKLVSITLSGCYNCLNLPVIGNLPLLQNLVLKYMDKLTSLSSSLGQDATESKNHLSPSLRSLKVVGMKSLKKWSDRSSVMLSPVLDKLYIRGCPEIIFLDGSNHRSLVSLAIHSCENLVFIRSVQDLTSLKYLEIINCPSLLGSRDLLNHARSLGCKIIFDPEWIS